MSKYLFSILLAVMAAAGVVAQPAARPDFYPVPAEFQNQVLMDFLQEHPSCLLTSTSGQYVGQVDDTYTLYGFGSFIDNRGNQRIGLYRTGQFLYGITITGSSAMVGTTDQYVCYSLTSGGVEYVLKNGVRQQPTGVGAYSFASMRYANGDRYIGEICRGKRHGLGIYFYANGNFWYGEYVDGVRNGFGCLFRTGNTLRMGFWRGEDELRVREIKVINK